MSGERFDNLAFMVTEAEWIRPDGLMDELQAMREMLMTWSHEFGHNEHEPRMALITAMIADILLIMQLQYRVRELEHRKVKARRKRAKKTRTRKG